MNLQVFSDEQGYSTYQKNIQSAIRWNQIDKWVLQTLQNIENGLWYKQQITGALKLFFAGMLNIQNCIDLIKSTSVNLGFNPCRWMTVQE